MEWAAIPDDGALYEVAFSRGAFAGVTTIFFLCGTTASIYGPLLVTFAHHFRVSLPAAGAVVSVHFVGALCGVLPAWVALQRYPGRVVLAGALFTLALGAGGAALARSFLEMLASVVVIGLSFGAIDLSLNSLLVRAPKAGRAHRLSVANAGYAVGSIIGPMLVVIARPTNYPLLFTGLGIVAVSLTASTSGVGAPRISRAHPRARHPRRRAALGVFVTAFILYVATEAATAAWIAPQLHRVGYSQSTGAVVTAGFWLGLSIGRFLAGPAHRRLNDRRLVFFGLTVAVVLVLGASIDPLAPVVYPLAGLSLALVYPMGLIWFTNLNPGDGDAIVILIFTMMAGGVIGPALTGVAVSVAGVRAVPVCIALFATADLAVFLVARQFRVLPGSMPGMPHPSS